VRLRVRTGLCACGEAASRARAKGALCLRRIGCPPVGRCECGAGALLCSLTPNVCVPLALSRRHLAQPPS
jgi:hypothetical protein